MILDTCPGWLLFASWLTWNLKTSILNLKRELCRVYVHIIPTYCARDFLKIFSMLSHVLSPDHHVIYVYLQFSPYLIREDHIHQSLIGFIDLLEAKWNDLIVLVASVSHEYPERSNKWIHFDMVISRLCIHKTRVLWHDASPIIFPILDRAYKPYEQEKFGQLNLHSSSIFYFLSLPWLHLLAKMGTWYL